MTSEILFLAWESPWPAFGGGPMRMLGLLKELSKTYPVHLMVVSAKPLSAEQETELRNYAISITRVPLASATLSDKLRIAASMVTRRMPYHCALLALSFRRAPDKLKEIHAFPGVVYANYGHWGTLVRGRQARNWILDQQNADVDFWRVYATQATSVWLKLVALLNWRLAEAHFPRIYSSVGCVVSVCEADRQLTLDLAPQAQVVVIENGVDCAYYVPDRASRSVPPRLLFTGTSAPRNVLALRQFVRGVWPLVQRKLPDTELLVAGNFKPEAQVEFKQYNNIRFTGRVDDIRPYFNQSDVFIAPFEETHGSKLKIAEAMAMGMAIVSTPEGVRGFALVDGESVLIAHNKEEFATQVIALLEDPARQARLGMAAREIALSTIDWKVLGQRLIAIVEATRGCFSI
ncbi:MAG TPA: glycosyltransferase [Anaerolineae bacterium]|nr:glycosyltransferase [Anaerolineae bacterium]HQK12343.1 glycosyltransferase [Anaerolineae bacterium]